MSVSTKLMAAVSLLCAFGGTAFASDASDIARIDKLPVPVVESVLTNVDSYFASAGAPSNQTMSGTIKSLALKVIKSHLSSLDDIAPGKATDATDEEKNATYRAIVRVSRRDTSEASDCVENKITLTSAEGLPVVKDGVYGFDMVHPHVTNWEWKLTFCRAPTSGGDYSDWQFAPGK